MSILYPVQSSPVIRDGRPSGIPEDY